MSKPLIIKLSIIGLTMLVVYVGFSSLKEYYRRASGEKELEDLKQEISQLQNSNSELLNFMKYLQSSDFKEEEARAKLNLKKPGEHVVVVPQVAGAHDQASSQDNRTNPQKWIDYFFSDQQ